ncbi:M48 family metalloprotease [Oleiagrimonas sp. C23AA]|uniref:M48 family metalloprotease n=1 Tax=Oleiagrimonas sp. C23AA TaxID=2719047 RepID=UPI0014237FCE|nr:M48 family metalloprotease [Oleiagrimonas sp. C23AA]NII11805.1 M48 family metallopeptidase [Oleiagrimonas sp. C23AA]
MRLRALFTALFAAGLTFAVGAQDTRLPDLGSSADALLSPAEAKAYGAAMLHQMRALHMVMDDPQIDEYINSVGFRLAAASDDPKHHFTFFVDSDQDINAFAAPGGYIGVNAGLIVIARDESELAAVMAHEIGHITQHHLERAFEASKKDAPLMALVALGAIAAGAAGGHGDAGAAVMMGGQGLIAQRQINFTRKDETEADRVGIHTLARAGYHPEAMADFFQRMESVLSANGSDTDVPELLQTHPVTEHRIADAKAQAHVIEQQEKRDRLSLSQSDWSHTTAPIPFVKNSNDLIGPPDDASHGPTLFHLMRERVRVLSGDATQLTGYYARNLAGSHGFDTPSNHYGYALALMGAGRFQAARQQLAPLAKAWPDSVPIQLAMGTVLAHQHQMDQADVIFARLHANAPNDHAIAAEYAEALLLQPGKASARKAANLLKPLLDDSEDPSLYQTYGRATDRAGQPVESGIAFADAAYLTGRPVDAMEQLRRLLDRPHLGYYDRAKVQARIDDLTPLVLREEKERREHGADDGTD